MNNFGPRSLIRSAAALARNAFIWLAIAGYAVSFFAFMALLSIEDVSFAVPATAGAYVVETVLARIFLKERISARRSAAAVPGCLRRCADFLVADRAELVTHFPAAALGLLLVCATVCYLGVCYSAWRFRRGRNHHSSEDGNPIALPALSVLKPLSGSAPALYENIRAHALQDYPEFELLFGVSGVSGPAAEAVRRLALEFPRLRIELVECGSSPEGNPKVFALEKLAAQASHDLLLVTTAIFGWGVVISGAS